MGDFAKGGRGSYKSRHGRARAFDADPEVQELVAEQRDDALEGLTGSYSADNAAARRAQEIDVDGIARQGLRYERLDQLMMEHLLGAR